MIFGLFTTQTFEFATFTPTLAFVVVWTVTAFDFDRLF